MLISAMGFAAMLLKGGMRDGQGGDGGNENYVSLDEDGYVSYKPVWSLSLSYGITMRRHIGSYKP